MTKGESIIKNKDEGAENCLKSRQKTDIMKRSTLLFLLITPFFFISCTEEQENETIISQGEPKLLFTKYNLAWKETISHPDFDSLNTNFTIGTVDINDTYFLADRTNPDYEMYVFETTTGSTYTNLVYARYYRGSIDRVFFEDRSAVTSAGGTSSLYYRDNKNYFSYDIAPQRSGYIITDTDEGENLTGAAEGWWSCTTNCFHVSTTDCESDPECNFLCWLTGCESDIATACAIVCI